jgi:hypothetical protein
MAIATGDVNLVKVTHETLKCLPPRACVDAARSGSLACLQYVHKQSDEVNLRLHVVKAAIEAGSLECLEYAISQGFCVPSDACVLATKQGALCCLQYLFSLPCVPRDFRVCFAAAMAGHVECLRFAVEAAQGILIYGINLMEEVVVSGYLD